MTCSFQVVVNFASSVPPATWRRKFN